MSRGTQWLVAVIASVCALLGTASAFADPPELIFKVSNTAITPFGGVLNDLRKARVVFVGEQHNNPEHHRAQLEVIGNLKEYRTPVSIPAVTSEIPSRYR